MTNGIAPFKNYHHLSINKIENLSFYLARNLKNVGSSCALHIHNIIMILILFEFQIVRYEK